jgi:hypothetical protein
MKRAWSKRHTRGLAHASYSVAQRGKELKDSAIMLHIAGRLQFNLRDLRDKPGDFGPALGSRTRSGRVTGNTDISFPEGGPVLETSVLFEC